MSVNIFENSSGIGHTVEYRYFARLWFVVVSLDVKFKERVK